MLRYVGRDAAYEKCQISNSHFSALYSLAVGKIKKKVQHTYNKLRMLQILKYFLPETH